MLRRCSGVALAWAPTNGAASASLCHWLGWSPAACAPHATWLCFATRARGGLFCAGEHLHVHPFDLHGEWRAYAVSGASGQHGQGEVLVILGQQCSAAVTIGSNLSLRFGMTIPPTICHGVGVLAVPGVRVVMRLGIDITYASEQHLRGQCGHGEPAAFVTELAAGIHGAEHRGHHNHQQPHGNEAFQQRDTAVLTR